MRILVVSHPPLDPTLGAAQTALELSQALRDLGHEVVTWSPSPLPGKPRGFRASLEQSSRLEAFLANGPRFDVIDLPAISLTPTVARHGFTVARSVQPEFAYQRAELISALRQLSPRLPLHALKALRVRRAIVSGWQQSDAILCLGSQEKVWMLDRFPAWRHKLHRYFAAPPADGRKKLMALRESRLLASDSEKRILWLGRWAAHKGVDLLERVIAANRNRGGPGITLAGCGDLAPRSLPPDWIADGTVRMVPRYTRDDLPRLLADHSIGLFTSVVEGWGLSLSEMLESGQTVYATSAGGVPDLAPYFQKTLRNLTPGISFQTAVPEDLAENRYFETFSWPAIAQRYQEEILNLARYPPMIFNETKAVGND